MTVEFARNFRQKRSSVPTIHASSAPASPACTTLRPFERMSLTRISISNEAGYSGFSPDVRRRFERTDETPFRAIAGAYSYPIRPNYRLLGGFP